MKSVILVLALLVLTVAMASFAPSAAGQIQFPSYPDRSGPVTDFANCLSGKTRVQLGKDISAAQERMGVEVVVVTVPDSFLRVLHGYVYAKMLARRWDLGKNTSGRWVVILGDTSGGIYLLYSENLLTVFSSHRAQVITYDTSQRLEGSELSERNLKIEAEGVLNIIAPTIPPENGLRYTQKAPYVIGAFSFVGSFQTRRVRL
jgi:hypothetical protein